MKTYVLGTLAMWALLSHSSMAFDNVFETEAECERPCPPVWSAPSPTLDDPCHHTVGRTPFASHTRDRSYTSPHIHGYAGMGCCKGKQKPTCFCPLVYCLAGDERCWSPAYCDAPTECGGGYCQSERSGWENLSEWESLGHIPNDSAAAAVEGRRGGGGGSTGGPASLLESLRGSL